MGVNNLSVNNLSSCYIDCQVVNSLRIEIGNRKLRGDEELHVGTYVLLPIVIFPLSPRERQAPYLNINVKKNRLRCEYYLFFL